MRYLYCDFEGSSAEARSKNAERGTRLSEQEADELIAKADADGDGKLSFDEVQKALVDLLADEKKAGGSLHDKEAPPLKVFQFNKHTPATSRHNKIHEFQHGKASGAYVFVVTVQTAAVGITLTAATRVYLMEPLSDPAAEVQAAGRIHRLGQTKEVFVKKFCYKDSIDGAIVELHKQLSAGTLSIVDNMFPVGALRILQVDR